MIREMVLAVIRGATAIILELIRKGGRV